MGFAGDTSTEVAVPGQEVDADQQHSTQHRYLGEPLRETLALVKLK